MPYKDPEKLKEFKREQMKHRRAQAKLTKADGTCPSAAEVLPPSANKSEFGSLPQNSVLTPNIAPAPASQIQSQGGQMESRSPHKAEIAGSTPAPATKTPQELAQEAGDRGKELLETRGWCLWKCSLFNNDIIVVIRDESVTDYPKGHAIWTDEEMKRVPYIELGTLRRIQGMKKAGTCFILPGFETAVKEVGFAY